MTRLPTRFIKALRLEKEPRKRLLVATATVTMVALMLRVSGYSRTIGRLSRRLGTAKEPQEPSAAQHLVESHAWAVRAAGETLPWARCLPRSVSLWWLLARRGIETEIQFGVRRGEKDLSAHAWVEWQDQTVSEPTDQREIYTHLSAG